MHPFSLALCSAVCLAATVALSTGGHSAEGSQASDSLSRRGVRPAASFHQVSSSAPSSAFPVPLPPPPSWPCFRDESILCTCRGSTANCSHAHGRLSYIPAFPRNITTLIFSFNNLTSIATAEFFLNVTQLVSLNMSHNRLGSIHAEAFEPLTKLQVLDLGFNDLIYNELSAVFAAPNVKELYVRHMQLGPLPRDYFHRTPSARLTVLDLGGNPIQSLNLSVLAPLKVLTRLSCASCNIGSITSDHLPNLIRLQLQHNELLDLPDSCRNGSSLFPSLKSLYLDYNSISGFTSSDICLPNLENLNFSRNLLTEVKQDMFNEKYFPRLALLDLSWTRPIRKLEQYAFRNPTLQTLSLRNCYIKFFDTNIHPDCFAGMPSLRLLMLSHNLGSYIPDQKLNRLFAPLTSVEKLYLGSWNMKSIRSNPFSKMTKLRVLELYANNLVEIPDGAFDLNPNLTYLVIDDNQLQTISSSMFNAATRKRLSHLDFSGNPLVCDCDLLWFKDWVVSSPALFKGSYRDYTCANLNYTLLQVFFMREQVCFFSHKTYTILIIIISILISIISILVLALGMFSTWYPLRWHMRLWYSYPQYRWHMRLYGARDRDDEAQRWRQHLVTGSFKYDVFVSYAEEDEAWVCRHLIPELEGRLGLRLCLHDRVFVPGPVIGDLVESVDASKKVLVLFSRHFVASYWCQFEFALCQSHVMEHGDALLVTCLEDGTSLNVTNAMLAVLKVNTYIQWGDSDAARASFWGRLRLAMTDILPPTPRHV